MFSSHEKVQEMLSLKLKNFKGLNNDIFDQQSQGYFPDIFRRCFTVVFLIISKKITIKFKFKFIENRLYHRYFSVNITTF